MNHRPTTHKAVPKNTDKRLVRRMIDSHSVLGLAFAALTYVISLSGALALFVSEIALWETSGAPTAYEASPAAIAAAANNALLEANPNNEIVNVIVYAPNEFGPYLAARLNQRADAKSPLISTDWIADPGNGKLHQKASAPFSDLIEKLHTDLLLPQPWGRYLVGIAGVAMFTLILSGILAHPTIIKDAFKLRLTRNARLAWTDIHNRLSVWGLPFHLIITFTGAFLGIAGIVVAALAMLAYDGDEEAALHVIQGPQPVENAAALPGTPNYLAMIEASRAENRRFTLLVGSDPNSSGHTTSVVYSEENILSARSVDIYRNTGEFLEKMGGEGSSGGARAFGMVQPLHYGTFGSYPIKLAYTLLALALTYITSSGMMIWFKRKKQQGEPKTKTEAAWKGMTTGLSLSLALTALVTVLGADTALYINFLLPFFLAGWVAIGLTVGFANNLKRAVQVGNACVGAVLIFTGALHLPKALSASSAGVPMLVTIDLSIMLVAVGYFVACLKADPAKVNRG